MTSKNHTGRENNNFSEPVDVDKNLGSNHPVNGFDDAHSLLSLLLNNAKELLILIDRQFNIQFITGSTQRQFATLFNVDLQKGQNLLSVASEQNQPLIRDIYEDVLKGNIRETESSHLVNGESVYLRNTFRPAKNEQGEIVGIIINAYDITEYKKNQLALEEAELRWQFASEGSNYGLFDWNIQTGYIFFSKSYKRLYGFEDDELPNHIDEWSSRIHPEDRQITSTALQEHFSNSEPTYDSSYRIKDKSGIYRWILSRGMIVSRDAQGKPLRMIGTHTDITRYKITEANYRLLFYSNPLPMWTIVPATLRFLEVNDQAVAHYGYSREEFLSMTLSDIHLPVDRQDLNITFNNSQQNAHFTRSGIRHLKKDGTVIYVEITGHIIEQDGNNICLITCLDITEKLLAEQSLQNSEVKYRTLFVNNPLPSWYYNPETQQILEVNEAAVRQYGYTEEEFKQLTIKELHPIDEQPNAERAIREARNKKTSVGTWRHQKKNGEEIYVEVRSSGIEYQNQKARLVVIHDKTAEVKAERELLKSNERFRLATLAASEVLWDWNLQTNEMYVSDALTKQFGWEVKDKHLFGEWHQYIHPEDRAYTLESFSKAIADPAAERWEKEYRFLKKDGTYATVVDKVYIQRDEYGNTIKVVGAIHDISDLKIKEKQLTESIERFNAVLKATNDLIWDWNLENGQVYRDAGRLQMVYGVANEADIKGIKNWLQRIHPEDSTRIQQIINDILHSYDQDTFEAEYRYRRDDNRYNYVYDRGIIIRNAEGRPIRIIGAAENITERKRLEMQLLKKELDKQKLISQAIIETQEQERSEIGKELHDNVNQVLTTTKLYLDLSISNAEMKDELILKSSKNIIYVINEIRQLSRSLMNPSLGDLGLSESIQELIDSVNLTGRLITRLNSAPSLENSLSENQKLMVYRIVQETVNNALKHAEAQVVNIKIHDYDQWVELFIEDDGIGFNFDTVKKGSGLKHIQNRVYLANGTLTINTAPGKGCRIMINFPKHTNPI